MGLDFERLARLESVCAKQHLLLDELVAKQQSLQRFCESLKHEHRCLAAEHDLLTSCLTSKEVVSSSELLEARRVQECTLLVRDSLQVPGLAEHIGHFVGFWVTRSLAGTCKAFWDGIQTTLQAVKTAAHPQFYVCGGSSAGSFLPLPTVERLDLRTGAWESVPPMPSARRWCGVAAIGGALYVVGGEANGKTLADSERFCPVTELWDELPPMPTARSHCAVTAHRRRLQVFGGRDTFSSSAVVECYDPSSNVWSSFPSMAQRRDTCAAAASEGRAYIVGGRESAGGDCALVDAVEVLDLHTNSWHMLPPLPTPRVGCAATVCSGCLYVLGGHVLRSPVATSPALGVVERLVLNTTTWEQVHTMPTPRSHCAAVVAADCIHVFGRSYMCCFDHGSAVETLDVGAHDGAQPAWSSLQVRMLSLRFAFAVAALRI
mmetsp:Transcript_54218/g.100196  ORF Transcript_54218/g.100196 Transcript_54218/m.100196 type:complete len:433 (-) Transcript_54218:23-1321(-)